MQKFNTIFLDAGGVLFETFVKQDERIQKLMTERGYSNSKIAAAIKKARKETPMLFVTSWEEEKQYYETFYGTMAEELGDMSLVNELFYCTHYAGHCELYPETIEVLEALRGKYQLGIISNAMPSMEWVFDRLGLRKYFDSITLSAHAKAAKPDEGIYQNALNQVHAMPEESVFIDDKSENVQAAASIGMKGWQLDRNKENLLELLQRHNLLL